MHILNANRCGKKKDGNQTVTPFSFYIYFLGSNIIMCKSQIQYRSKVSHLKLVTVSCFILLALTCLYSSSLLSFNLDLSIGALLDYFGLFLHLIVYFI